MSIVNSPLSLPLPSAEAISHSKRLQAHIQQQMIEADGSIPFQDYMASALYAAGLGYYVAGAHKIGGAGDFVTAPEISPLFSQCVAYQCEQILQTLAQQGAPADMLELGAGLGTMAADILLQLERLDCLPQRYFILDLSPELKQRQYQTLQAKAPHLLARVRWLSHLPEDFRGIIVGNEVLDAMPIRLFHWQNNQLSEWHVRLATRTSRDNPTLTSPFVLQKKPPSEPLQQAILPMAEALQWSVHFPENLPYTSEINTQLAAWFKSIARSLQQGVLLLVDYGYTRREYYLPERNNGTLLCHYRHHVHDDPLLYCGLQDITSSVDFTAVAECASEMGLELAGFTTQAAFLSQTNLEQLFVDALNAHPEQQYALAKQVRTLSLPAQMGERFKVMAMSKAFKLNLRGFQHFDQRHRL
ncbi:MAG: class I SAM-dependent methyltransferase [bacterium]